MLYYALQIHQNLVRKSPGDYSALTAGLACAGCTVRLYTTVRLAASDPILLAGFSASFTCNFTLLVQVLWYGGRGGAAVAAVNPVRRLRAPPMGRQIKLKAHEAELRNTCSEPFE